MELNKYRFMWIVAMFDLPTDTKTARRDYTRFRGHLLKDGFSQMQYSVYIRHCPSQENVDVHVGRIESALPPDGEVRVLVVTEKQFERMRVFGENTAKPQNPPQRRWNFSDPKASQTLCGKHLTRPVV